MGNRMVFSKLTYREKLTICNEIYCQHRGENFTLLKKYFKQDEHPIVRNFIQVNHDEIVRKKLEFLNLSESAKISLIERHQLHIDIDNNSTIRYMFWKEDQDEIRAFIKRYVNGY